MSGFVHAVDDPMVMTHARALLSSTEQGRTRYIEEDLRNPDRILDHPDLRDTLDFGRPVALMLIAVLHFLPDQAEAVAVVRRLIAELPAGSYVAATVATPDFLPAEVAAAFREMVAKGQVEVWARDADQFAEFFDGLELVGPGIVRVGDWRPDLRPAGESAAGPEPVSIYGAVGRKH